MADFYDEIRDVAREVVTEFKQGTAQKLKRVVLTPGANSWDEPTETPTLYDVVLVSRRVNQRYENGTLIVETGDVVTFPPPEVEPLMTDKMVIDGTERTITSLRRIPSAGTVVVYKAFVAL